MPVVLNLCFFVRRDDFESPKNRSLTVTALFGAGLSLLQKCPHESGHGRPEARSTDGLLAADAVA